MSLEDLGAAIAGHSHYVDDSDKFWETMAEKYWAEYEATPGHHSLSDFQVWCEDNNLIPDDEIFENE